MAQNPSETKAGITRRQFLGGAATAASWVAVSPARWLLGLPPQADSPQRHLTVRTSFLPRIDQQGSQPKVVHVHGSAATFWDYATGWYGDYVRQDHVDAMVDLGLMALTGTASRAAAWWALIPDYMPGQRVAIKVNLNNARSADDADNTIDALIEPVNSVIAGLKEIGVAESDIWVYDAVRWIPNRFRNGCDFSGVQFSGQNVNPLGFSDTEQVTFEPPPGGPPLAAQRISQVLASADYLINMPIMKKHGHAYVTLSFKNHFGSINQCSDLHGFTFPYLGSYTQAYNPLVDIYRNRHFVGKTVLTIGDGLYGSRVDQASQPGPWTTFQGKSPNSLFFSTDPVAIDCIMYDFLEAEAGVPAAGDDYLVLAAQQGLGVFEHRAPGVSNHEDWYRLIAYTYLDLDAVPILSAPPHGTLLCDDTPRFEWAPVPAATSYQIQVDDDASFSSPAIDATTVEASYMPDAALPAGTYAWRVRAESPVRSSWSPEWQFSVASIPAAPSLAIPADGATSCHPLPRFAWSEVMGATSYRLQVSADPGFSSPAVDMTTTDCACRPDVTLPSGICFWRVRAANDCGSGEWSAVRSFTCSLCAYLPMSMRSR